MKLNKTLKGIVLAGALTTSLIGCKQDTQDQTHFTYNLEGKIANVPLPSNRGAMGLAAADFDNDGDIDLATVKNYGTDKGIVSLYRNDGLGNYSLVGPIARVPLPAHRGAMGLAAADFDNDGDIDLATVKNYGTDKGDITLYLNDGSDKFTKY
ncbi:VCBS repeat-containing protein [Candidatus Woesearchaeota archaeon]|jgi:hypothetical protein|nr:VCBS repeat-containing protein [Candidatus Woesearchaeota archaeon]MBT4835012.1 VCBS repeat-containing protein [Candidatus Woesearchaeota archaeon]MBT6735165.1 VCBS repeat-containing protein [Candidatus Woesearchaeota archaeon]MBT7170105.1 VCBS repeat-containing protein [Candidatus Woesearchaeota archaeon]MBT7474954.1 VCBS repeat-containing protein [Candidatus Woesearchaeota archaeon]